MQEHQPGGESGKGCVRSVNAEHVIGRGRWAPDGPDSPDLALLKFTPDTADDWNAPSSRMIRAFGVIVSMAAGKPIAMGEHGTHTGLSSGSAAAAAIS